MKINTERLKNQIDEHINYGAAHSEECDVTLSKIMQTIEPLIIAVKELGESKWIPTSERLPELGEEYNCAQDLKDGMGGLVSTTLEWDAIDKVWCYPGSVLEADNVTHWMPLPNPPDHA